MSKKLMRSALAYRAIIDYPDEVKTKILILVNSPELDLHKKLMELLEQASKNKAEILALVSNESIIKSSVILPALAHY